jgi:hypothetical protein
VYLHFIFIVLDLILYLNILYVYVRTYFSSLLESLSEAETLCRAYSSGTNAMMELDRVRVLESVRVGILFLSHICIDDFEGDICGRIGK